MTMYKEFILKYSDTNLDKEHKFMNLVVHPLEKEEGEEGITIIAILIVPCFFRQARGSDNV